MIVRSLKINNIYESGEVNLDKHIPKAVNSLDTIKSLGANVNVLGAKNMLDDTKPVELTNFTQNGNTFFNSISTSNKGEIRITYYNSNDSELSYDDYRELPYFNKGKHKYIISVPENTNYIIISFRGIKVPGSFNIKYQWNSPGNYILLFDIVNNKAPVEGEFVIKDLMLTLASEADLTYTPYAMGNQELTQRLLSLEQRVAALEG